MNAKKLLSRTRRDAWRVEALEPRVLLSADPVLGGLHALLMPVGDTDATGIDAYQAEPAVLPATPIDEQAAIDGAALIAAGQFQIGAQGSSQPIQLTAPEGGALFAAGDLVLYSDGLGGHIRQDGDLIVTGSVNVFGSGHTYLLSGNISAGGTYTNSDSIRVDGARSVASTGGNVVLGGNNTHYLGGNSSSTVDTLSVSATGNIIFNGALAAGSEGGDLLSGLSITAAQNVTFEQAVEINGDLIINATGIVTFKSTILLKNGGDLIINGATQIVLQGPIGLQTGGAATAGDILLEADEIDFLGIGEELITGTGSVTLRPSTLATTMAIFSPSGAGTAGVLNLESSELKSFADGFSSFTFGHQSGGHAVAGSGTVLVGASASVDSVALQSSAQIYGGSITVVDYSDRNAILRLGTGDTLKLDATGDIAIANEIETDTLVLASSSGRIQQNDAASDNRTGEALRALDLTVTAFTGVSLPHLELQRLSVVNSGAGDVDLGIDPARTTARFDNTILTGAIAVQQLAQTAGSSGNDITLLARAGSITLAAGSGIAIAGNGTLSLTAQSAGTDLSLLAPISVQGGAVTLSAADTLSSNASGSITSTGASAVALTSGTGALTLGAAVSTVGGSLSLNSGAALNLTGVTLDAGASGVITLSAVGDLSIGIIQAANAITLTSTTGALLDALAGDGANLRGEAAVVSLSAATGIGTGVAPLRTAIGSLTATVSGGSLFIAEESALAIAAGGLSTAGSGAGAIVVVNASGSIDVAGAVHAAAASGHLLLQSAGDLNLAASVTAEHGSISLVAAQALLMTGAIEVRSRGTNETLDLRSGGAMSIAADALLATLNATQRLDAGGALLLGRIDAGSGAVSLKATAIASAAGSRTDITAGALRLQASSGAIGSAGDALGIQATRLAAAAGGVIVLQETDGLTLGGIDGVAAKRVAADGTASTPTADARLSGLAAGGALVLQNSAGDLALESGASIASNGNLLLAAAGAMTLDGALSSGGGAISLLAGGALSLSAAADVGSAGGAIDLQSGAALSMAAGTHLASAGGAQRLQAAAALSLGQLDAGSGDALLIGSRIASAVGGVGSGVDVTAQALRLQATGTAVGDGIGSAVDALNLQVQTLALSSSGAAGVFLTEADAVTVAALAAPTGQRVQGDGTLAALSPDAALAGLSSSAASLVLASGGALSVHSTATVQAKALRLAAGGDLTVAGALSSASALSLSSGNDLLLQANITAAGGKGLDLAAARDLTMTAGARATAAGSSNLAAGGNVRVAEIDAGSAALALTAGGFIWDADTPGDALVNLRAGALLLSAAGGVGTNANLLETAVTSLAAQGGSGGLFLSESDGLAIASVSVTADRVAADGSLATAALLSGDGFAASGSATLLLNLLSGNLAVNSAVQGGGSLRLAAEAGTLSLAAAVASSGGPVTVLAGGAVQQGSAGDLSGSSLDLQSGGAWTMADGAEALTTGGTLRLAAAGNLTVGRLDAGSGAMALTATGLRDIAGEPDTAADLTAGSLRITASGTGSSDGVGTAADALELSVQQLVIDARGGGVFLNQSGAVTVGNQGALTTDRVGVDGWLQSGGVSDAGFSGIASAGSLVLRAAGTLQVSGAVTAGGTVLLAASGAASALSIDADLKSSTAVVSLLAGADLLVTAKVSSEGSGRSLDLQAGRDILLQEGSSLLSKNGVIALQAGDDVLIESIDAGTAHVAVLAGTGNIVDGDAAGDAEIDIKAAGLRLQAAGSIGLGSNAIETSVSSLAAAGASIAIAETQGLRIERVAVSLQRIGTDGVAQALDLGAQEDMLATTDLLLSVASGELLVEGGTATPAIAVTAGGSVLLRSVAGAVTLNAALSAGGAVSLRAGTDLSLGAGGDLNLASLDAEAGASLNMADGAVITAASGNLRLSAVLNMSLGALSTGGDVSLLARSISDAGGAETDVAARSLRVFTTGAGTIQGFGTGALPIALQVTTLAAEVAGIGAGGLFVRELDGLSIGSVGPLVVKRVGSDGLLADLSDAALSDLVSAGNVVLVSAAGSIAVTDGSNADGRGLLAGGNVLLDAAQDLTLNAALRSTAGSMSLLSGAGISINAEAALARSGRTLELQAGGAVAMGVAGALVSVDSAIRVLAAGDISIASIAAGRGNVSLISTGGSILEAGSDAAVDVTAAGLRLSAAVGVGTAAERLDTAVTTLTARAAGGGVWVQDADAVTIGSVEVSVRRVSSLATTATEIVDAAQTDVITTGGGAIAVGADINSRAGLGAEPVALDGNGGDVRFDGAIGNVTPLVGLSVLDAHDVSFAKDVKLAGDLVVQASGRVQFLGGLDLSSGSLSIIGATELVIGNVVIASGNAVLHVDALVLSGLLSGSASARLELAGAGSGSGVFVGAGSGTGLSLDAAQLAAMQGFGIVQLGSLAQGPTTVDLGTLVSLVTPALELAGAALTLQGSGSLSAQLLSLNAAQDLTLGGSLRLSGSGADVQATVGGALRMAADALISTQAGDVRLQTVSDLVISRIDTRAGGVAGGAAGAVVLASSAGVIQEAGNDGQTDVFADLLTLRGHGPLLTAGESTAARALDVVANHLDVDAAAGVILRDTGTDGRTRINLLVGSQLYQQLVADGSPLRQPSEVALPGVAGAQDSWAWLAALRPLPESRDNGLMALPVLSSRMAAAAPMRFDDAPLSLSAGEPRGLALQRSLDADLPSLVIDDPDRFQLWSEALSL